MNIDECIIVTACFSQSEPTLFGFHKLQFSEKDEIVIVSCSIENSYLLFGFRLKTQKEYYYRDSIEV